MKLLQTIKIVNILKCLSNRSSWEVPYIFIWTFIFPNAAHRPILHRQPRSVLCSKVTSLLSIRHYQVRHPLTPPPHPPPPKNSKTEKKTTTKKKTKKKKKKNIQRHHPTNHGHWNSKCSACPRSMMFWQPFHFSHFVLGGPVNV